MLETAAREERSPAWLLDQLLTSERTHRFERRVAANLKLSGIPNRKSLDDFDFDAQPGVSQRTVADLATLRFLRAGENVLILGPTGVGKTHLAIGLTLKLALNSPEAQSRSSEEAVACGTRFVV